VKIYLLTEWWSFCRPIFHSLRSGPVFGNFSCLQILRPFAKLWKTTVSFNTSVRFSVLRAFVRMKQLDSSEGFLLNLVFEHFLNTVEKIQFWLKSGKNIGYSTWRRMYIFDNISLNSSKNEKSFRQKILEKIKTYVLCSVMFFFFFSKSYLLQDNVKKYGRSGQVADDNAFYMLDN
jgi:hypothetical protein